MAAQSMLPVSMPQGAGSEAAAIGPQNPSLVKPDDVWMQLPIPEEDLQTTVKIVTDYCNDWTPDRLQRMRIWIKNVLFDRGVQVVTWDSNRNNWVDALAWYTGSDKVRDGESTELEKFLHPITSMLGVTFVSNIAREVPLTVVKPQDPRIEADMITADAAGEAIGIIERRNGARQMTRGEAKFLYLFGSYGKYVRGVLDGEFSGYDDEPIIGPIQVPDPATMRCVGCGKATPVDKLTAPPDGSLPQCPGCGTGMGPESYYPGGPDQTALGVLGMRKVPRAMVKMSIHSPLELTVCPTARELSATPILKYAQEIDLGEARMMFPNAFEEIQAGAQDTTSNNADDDKLKRSQSLSAGTAYSSDTEQKQPTYVQVWVQPMAYSSSPDKEYAKRMMALAPDGLKLTMVGAKVVGIKKAILIKEWSWCRLDETYGLYSKSIAENVVNFNERFNDAMALYHDYMMRAACGLNVVDGAMIDAEKWKGNTLSPATITPIPTKGGKRQLAQCFMHFDIPINPGLALYPQMLWNFAQLLNGMPPQVAGAGTNADVATYGGQQLQSDAAQQGMTPYWENIKEEHARAGANAIYCLKMLMKSGAAKEIWDVISDEGTQYKGNYINLDKLQGQVKVEADENQDLPATPFQMQTSYQKLMEEVGKGNPAAQQILDVPTNQEVIGKVLYPGVVLPSKAQRSKTLQDLNTLCTQTAMPQMRPDGSIGSKLPVEPSIVEHMDVAIPTIEEFMIENSDLQMKNPVGWSQMEQYHGLCQQMQTQQQVVTAQLKLKVQMASVPPKQPDAGEAGAQAALKEILSRALEMVDRQVELANMPPEGPNGNIGPQVTASSNVIKTAVETLKVAGGKK